MPDEHDVLTDEAAGDPRAAMEILTRLTARAAGNSGSDDTDGDTGLPDGDPRELLEGMMTLLLSFVPLLGDDPWGYIPPIVDRLGRIDVVEAEDIPTMTGALLAASSGRSPLAWRRSLQGADTDGVLDLPSNEAVGLIMSTWLVTEALDAANGPGTCHRLVNQVLGGS